MKIDDQLQNIAPDDIELIDWLPVKYAPKDPAGRSAECVSNLQLDKVLAMPLPRPTIRRDAVCVLRYPKGVHKSGKPYGLVHGYRRWRGAIKRRLSMIFTQVIHVTQEEYDDQHFRASLYLSVNPPCFTAMVSRATGQSERTVYRLVSIAERLCAELVDMPMSKAARLALTQVPADEQPAVLEELARTRRRFTAQNIRAAIRVRAGGSSLPDLTPLRTATKFCRQLLQRVDWSENDLELIGAVIVEHAITLKALTIYLGTQQAEMIGSSGPSQWVASRSTTPQYPTKSAAGSDMTQ